MLVVLLVDVGVSEILPKLLVSFFSSAGFFQLGVVFHDGVVSLGFSSSFGAAGFFQEGVLLDFQEGVFSSCLLSTVEVVVLADALVDTDE